MRYPSAIRAAHVSILHRAYTCGIVVISVCMVSALNIDCLHNLGTLFSVRHLLSISSSQLFKVRHRLFSCFISTLSMPAAFMFLGAAIPFLYSFSEKLYTSVTCCCLHTPHACLEVSFHNLK